ncbi:MAG TPA: hypothetical protein VL051_02605 [Burkholderiaceae bacterium]|nr:hypothetical protein [Burkholderiaceae bacterium]
MVQSDQKKRVAACLLCDAFPTPAAVAGIKSGFNVPLTGFAACNGRSALEGPSWR